MKPSHFLAITVRLFSIVLALYGVRQSSFLIELMGGGINGYAVSWLFAIASTVLPILLAIILWNFPLSVAKSIIKEEIDEPIKPIKPQLILAVLIASISFYFIFYAIVNAVYWATFWKMVEGSQGTQAPLYLNDQNRADMIATAFEFIASFLILLRAKSFAYKLWEITK